MTGRYAGKIDFPDHSKWVAVSQKGMASWAGRPDISTLAVRVLFAAMSRADRAGHAVFRPGELRDLLGSVDTATGELLPARSDTLRNGIRAAKRVGMIQDHSVARCLVLAPSMFQRAEGAALKCIHDDRPNG